MVNLYSVEHLCVYVTIIFNFQISNCLKQIFTFNFKHHHNNFIDTQIPLKENAHAHTFDEDIDPTLIDYDKISRLHYEASHGNGIHSANSVQSAAPGNDRLVDYDK